MNKILLPGFTVFSLGVLFWSSCNSGAKQTGPGAADPNAPKEYQVITLSPQKAVLNTDFPATIEGEQTVEIRPRIDGNIEQIFVNEGSSVKKGQTLFRINGDIFEQQVRSAAANVKIAQANVNTAGMQVNKVKPLVEKDIISKFELESAQYGLESQKAALAQAMAALSNARTNLSYTYVTSPANGVIGRIPYKVGALVSSNISEPLTTVANSRRVFAYFSMNENQLLEFSRITKGATLQEKFSKLPPVELILSDGTVYPEKGKIETASGLINPETGSSSIKAVFKNSLGIIRSGSSGTVRIPVEIDTALLVPQSATYEIQGKRFAYKVDSSGVVVSVPIIVNSASTGHAFVVQQGLRSGDKIVVEGVSALRDSTKIKPVSANPDSIYKKN